VVTNVQQGEVEERLRRRYPPPRIPRGVLIALVSILAVALLSWVIWSATLQSRPAVSGNVTAYTVQSDARISVTLTVDRPDPSVAAVCRVVAQAVDFELVAEQQVPVPPDQARVVNITLELTTLRRATSASVRECTT
jgi:hypothetical protein